VSMKVVMMSKTPLAGAPYENMCCLNKYTDVKVRWICWRDRYADGRVFPSDLIWGRDTQACREVLKEADIIHIQNEIFNNADNIICDKRKLVQFHSVPKRRTYDTFASMTKHVYTLSQPLQRREYHGLAGLPNMMDPEKYKPVDSRNWDRVRITFAPTNKWNINMIGTKGMHEVTDVLNRLGGIADIKIYSSVSYVDNLDIKRNSDILIDDVINNTFHRTSLEGSCFGLAVITSTGEEGWIKCNIRNLEGTLRRLINDRDELMKWKDKSRQWIEKWWHPIDMCEKFVRAYRECLTNK